MIGLNQGRCQGPRQAGAARPALIVTTGRMAPGSVAEGGQRCNDGWPPKSGRFRI